MSDNHRNELTASQLVCFAALVALLVIAMIVLLTGCL